MRPRVELFNARGKTVEDYVASPYSGQLVITFTDGTFLALRPTGGTGERDDSPEIKDDGDLEVSYAHLERIDIATVAELQAVHEAKVAKFVVLREAEERATYERLRQKFEG